MTASKLPPQKAQQFLNPKIFYSRYTWVTRKFRRMKVIARSRNETWCINLAFVDKLSTHSNGVFYLFVGHFRFDRTHNAKWIKTKSSKETDVFLKVGTKKNRPQKGSGGSRYRVSGRVYKNFVAEEIQIISKNGGKISPCRKHNQVPLKRFFPIKGRFWVPYYSQNR